MSKDRKDQRYPYTYAADFMRAFGGVDSGGVKLSRSDASQMRSRIADALGMPDEEVAKKLADYYLDNEESINEHTAREFMSVFAERSK